MTALIPTSPSGHDGFWLHPLDLAVVTATPPASDHGSSELSFSFHCACFAHGFGLPDDGDLWCGATRLAACNAAGGMMAARAVPVLVVALAVVLAVAAAPILTLASTPAEVTLISDTASATFADTPHRQLADGMPPEEIQCEYPRILMESPRGMPACVFDRNMSHLELRGFVKYTDRAYDDFYTFDSKGVLRYNISEGASAHFFIANSPPIPAPVVVIYVKSDSADGRLDLRIPTKYLDARTDGCGGATGTVFTVLDQNNAPAQYAEGRQTAHERHITIPFEGDAKFTIVGTCMRGTMVVDRDADMAAPGSIDGAHTRVAVPDEPKKDWAAQDTHRPADTPYCIRYPVEQDSPKYDPGRLSELFMLAQFNENYIFSVWMELDDQQVEDFRDLFLRCYAHHYPFFGCSPDDMCFSNMSVRNILALGNYPQVSRIYVDYDSNRHNRTITEPGTLLDVRYVFRDYPDMSWVYMHPIQCGGNPYSGHVVSENFEQLRAYEQISAYYLREHGITVHDAVHMRGLFETTLSCSGKDGSRLYLLVDDQSLDTMMSLGFKTISTGLNIYGK